MRAFENCIELPIKRPEKPRKTGLNWAIDWGWGLAEARDMIQVVGEHIDIVKMPALSVRLQPRDQRKKSSTVTVVKRSRANSSVAADGS